MNGKKPYKDSQRMDDRDELLSTTDVDIASSDEEKDWSSMNRRSARRPQGRNFITVLKDYWWLITTCMLGATIILQLIIWREVSKLSTNKEPQVGGDYTAKGPTCSSPLGRAHPRVPPCGPKPSPQTTDVH